MQKRIRQDTTWWGSYSTESWTKNLNMSIKMVFARPRTRRWEWEAENSQGFWHKNSSTNLSQTTWPCDNQQKKKRICWREDFAVPAEHRVKIKESEKKDKYLLLSKELKKKTVEHESDGDINCSWCAWSDPQKIGEVTKRLGNKRTSRDLTDNIIIRTAQNTEKCPGDLKLLDVA